MKNINEKFLHSIWKYILFKSNNIFTKCGKKVQIISPGYYNESDAGPDFSQATIIIDEIKWVGNVEIHILASDWVKHLHHFDPAYQTIILHVVWEDDMGRVDGLRYFPTIELKNLVSQETLDKVHAVLENVVRKGTGSKLYSKDFSMAGKTGTAQVNYKDKSKLYYASSFVGYFPADHPKYSCIVVVHKPSTVNNNYYGADVAGPVFKRIAQKIFTDAPSTNEIKNLTRKIPKQENNYDSYFVKSQKKQNSIPNVKGMSGMDAIALLENLGMKVKAVGIGKVKKQSLQAGQNLVKNTTILLELS